MLIFSPAFGADVPAEWKAARTLASQGRHETAINHLKELEKSKDQSVRKDQVHLLMAKIYIETGIFDFAFSALETAKNEGTVLTDYYFFLKGEAHKAKGEMKEAQQAWEKGLESKPSLKMRQNLELALADLHFNQKQWAQAKSYYVKLEKRGRNQSWHPETLYRLIQIEWALNSKPRACTWAQEIYWRYPTHPLILSWGIDLEKNQVAGKNVGCMAKTVHQERRISRLQLAGAAEKAITELKVLQGRAAKSMQYMADKMLAEHYIQEGLVTDALKLLLNHYKTQKDDYDYLMLLARAASRAGEFQTAVGAYDRAHEVAKSSYKGRRALFQAAFLSYQFQDYDGAGRKFEDFRKKYPNSGLSRDSQWHLAWIKYLKGNYIGARESFATLLKARRSTRAWRHYPEERISYWLAMSHLRTGEVEKARPIFAKIAKGSLESYYTVAAASRLATLPEAPQRVPSSEASPDASLSEIVLAQGGGYVSEENESEEVLAEASDDEAGANEPETEEETWVGSGDLAPPEDRGRVTEFRDPALAARFEKARALSQLGEDVLARWELYEIESKTSNPDYRRMLVSEYKNVNEYYRSAYMATVYFGAERRGHGIEGVRYMWENAFPKAYDNFVQVYARSFSIPSEFIWSIMRAETYYRKDAISPVGAMGLMQVMPNTGQNMARILGIKGFEPEQLLEPETAIKIGSSYLKRLLKKFDGKVPLAAAGYNAGPHRVHSWLLTFGDLDMDEFIEHIPFLETRNYVKKVVAYNKVYASLYNPSQANFSWLSQPVGVKMNSPAPTRESWDTL